jgi:uncharacterized protein (TIGR00296 family)
MLNLEQGKELVKLARKAVETKKVEKKFSKKFEIKKGVFVTIETFPEKELRGCIGFPRAIYPLGEAVQRAAISAAYEDSRFEPLKKEELEKVVFEVSILTEPELIEVKSPEEYFEKIEEGKDENIIFMETNLEPKVSIPRVPIISEEKTQGLYFQENLDFYTITTSKGKKLIPFLYFLKTIDASLDEIFIPALNLFIEEGIGGERSTGKGQFDFYEKDESDLPDNGDFEITLSLSLPRREEVNNIIYFNLVKRDGFIYYQKPTGYRKKTHFKIGEGSLVRTPYIGENIDVSPIKDMRVISYGKSIGWKFS